MDLQSLPRYEWRYAGCLPIQYQQPDERSDAGFNGDCDHFIPLTFIVGGRNEL